MTSPLASTNQTDSRSSITPELVVRALRKHWLMVLSLTAGVFLAVAFSTFGQKRIYRAAATVHIDPSPPRPLGKDVQGVVDVGVGSFWSNKEYYATQHKILQSHALALEVVQKLGLNRDVRFMRNAAPNDPDPEPFEPPPTTDSAAMTLLARLTVEPDKESRLVVVKYDDADPERAHRVLATLVDTYLGNNVSRAVASIDAASEWLEEQVGNLKEELGDSELALHNFKKGNRILSVSLDDQSNMLREEMQQLNQALTAVQARQQGLRARCKELAKIDATDPQNVPASELLNNGTLTDLRTQYVKVKTDLAALLGAGKGQQHPEVVSAKARVEVAKKALLAEIRNVTGAVKSDLDAASNEARGLAGLFEKAKQRALDLNMMEIEYRRLERTRDNTERLYSVVLERSKESNLTGMMRFNNISIAEPARTSNDPVKPHIPRNLAIGLAAGLALGFAFAIGREALDRKIRTPDDLEHSTGLASFGLLPTVRGTPVRGSYGHRKRRRQQKLDGPLELVSHHDPGSAIAEAARGIRTNLLFASPDKPYRRILVTSANPGEGKTMVASTLAIALAHAGQKVLLVDCDLRRPRQHVLFGTTNDIGVSTAVVDHSSIDYERLQTSIPNLSLLPSGPHVATPTELLQSASFTNLLEELATHFDTLVVDSTPVISVADALVIAPRLDTTLLIARAGRTWRESAARSIRSLRDVGAKIAGCVLNDVDLENRSYAYRYHYYYYTRGYGGYGRAGSTDTSSSPPT